MRSVVVLVCIAALCIDAAEFASPRQATLGPNTGPGETTNEEFVNQVLEIMDKKGQGETESGTDSGVKPKAKETAYVMIGGKREVDEDTALPKGAFEMRSFGGDELPVVDAANQLPWMKPLQHDGQIKGLKPLPTCRDKENQHLKCAVCENYMIRMILGGIFNKAAEHPEYEALQNPLGLSCDWLKETDATITTVSFGSIKSSDAYRLCKDIRRELSWTNSASSFSDAFTRAVEGVRSQWTKSLMQDPYRCYADVQFNMANEMCSHLHCCPAVTAVGCPRFARQCETCAFALLYMGEDKSEGFYDLSKDKERLEFCKSDYENTMEVLKQDKEEAKAAYDSAVAVVHDTLKQIESHKTEREALQTLLEDMMEKKEDREKLEKELKSTPYCNSVWDTFETHLKKWVKAKTGQTCRFDTDTMRSKMGKIFPENRPFCLKVWYDHQEDPDSYSSDPCAAAQESFAGMRHRRGADEETHAWLSSYLCSKVVRAQWKAIKADEAVPDGESMCREVKERTKSTAKIMLEDVVQEYATLRQKAGGLDEDGVLTKIKRHSAAIETMSPLFKTLDEKEHAAQEASYRRLNFAQQTAAMHEQEVDGYSLCQSTLDRLFKALPEIVLEEHGKRCVVHKKWNPTPECVNVLKQLIEKQHLAENEFWTHRPAKDPPLLAPALAMCKKIFPMCTNKDDFKGDRFFMDDYWGERPIKSLKPTKPALKQTS